MTVPLVERYERLADGRVVIDVSAERVEDLYNDFDKVAPYAKKDLDQELVDYLIDCAREIGNRPFLIRLNFNHPPEKEREGRVRKSIDHFFGYLEIVERRKMGDLTRASMILLALGVVLLAVSLWFNRYFTGADGVVVGIAGEGLTVAAWVSMWESLATFLIHWPRHRRELSLFRRIASAEVHVRQFKTSTYTTQPA